LKYLLPFEKRNYFGIELDDDLPNMVLGAPRKMNKGESSPQKQKNEENAGLQSEIARTL